tara:strand:+ start:422 stop:694 length:273 start_codon:yes stop_codon:yes gene_type:complete
MAFSYTVENAQTLEGRTKIVFGTWNSAGVTGGEIVTGLTTVQTFVIAHTGSSTEAAAAVINETLPLSNATGTVTLVTTSGDTGTYIAIGV